MKNSLSGIWGQENSKSAGNSGIPGNEKAMPAFPRQFYAAAGKTIKEKHPTKKRSPENTTNN